MAQVSRLFFVPHNQNIFSSASLDQQMLACVRRLFQVRSFILFTLVRLGSGTPFKKRKKPPGSEPGSVPHPMLMWSSVRGQLPGGFYISQGRQEVGLGEKWLPEMKS